MPKRRQITVTFGDPEPVEILRAADTGRTDEKQISAASRDRVMALGAASGDAAGAELAEPTASVIEDRTNAGGRVWDTATSAEA